VHSLCRLDEETAAEDYLIRLFRPIWNKETKIIQGFGKHGDAPTTRKNKVSSWDVLHEGRAAAGHGVNPEQKSLAQLTQQLTDHFVKYPAYKNLNEVLDGFIGALRQT
jgi:Eco29kI restriction endonuclease